MNWLSKLFTQVITNLWVINVVNERDYNSCDFGTSVLVPHKILSLMMK